MLNSVCLLGGNCPGPCLCFAGMYALVPRVLQSCVTIAPTSFEPGSAASTTARFPGFRDRAAFGANQADARFGSFYGVLQGDIGQEQQQGDNSHQGMV